MAEVGPDGRVLQANDAWRRHGGDTTEAAVALGLADDDLEVLANAIAEVSSHGNSRWLNLNAHALRERRWSRFHLWQSPDGPTGDASVLLAVIPMREPIEGTAAANDWERLERVLEYTADSINILGADGSILFAGGLSDRLLGMTGAELEGTSALDMVHPDDVEYVVEALGICFDEPNRPIKVRFRAQHADGNERWLEAIGTNLLADPAVNGVLVSLNDITEIEQARVALEANEAALQAEKRRYQMLAQFTPTGVFEFTDTGEFTWGNERFREITGTTEHEQFTWDLIAEQDRRTLRTAWEREKRDGIVHTTVRLVTPQGVDKWVSLRMAKQDDGRFLASLEDHTAEVTTQRELAHRAGHDQLTGLPNREQLVEQLGSVMAEDEPMAVLFLDLDNFKDINDGLGHQFGDQVLVEVANRVVGVIRPQDIVGRLHGDEFVVICRGTDSSPMASEIAGRIVDAVGAPMTVAGHRLMVSGSVGITLHSRHDCHPSRNADRLLAEADVAMYEAKRRGRSRSVAFTPELQKRAGDRLRLHGEFQRAFELDELELHYQPIVELATGQARRTEALIRWHHPEQGFILPGRFVPDIEDSELIDLLGTWTIEQVVASLAEAGPTALPVNINISPRQLSGPGFSSIVLGILDRYGVPGSQVAIEITERVLMDDTAPVAEELGALRDHGVSVAIDDFGTGYSSLTYLRRFPFDQLKIDGAFIDSLATNESDRAIVRALIDLAGSLGAEVIAEKVETAEQVEALQALGCGFGQGYLLGRPAPQLITAAT